MSMRNRSTLSNTHYLPSGYPSIVTSSSSTVQQRTWLPTSLRNHYRPQRSSILLLASGYAPNEGECQRNKDHCNRSDAWYQDRRATDLLDKALKLCFAGTTNTWYNLLSFPSHQCIHSREKV